MITEEEITKKQILYFEKLSKEVSEQVKVYEGQKGYFKEKRIYRHSQRLAGGMLVNDRLRFNEKEIVLDPNGDWEHNKIYGNKIIKYLQKNKIPYDPQYSGRNNRFSIYLNPAIAITQKDCFYLYLWLCKEIGLDWKEFGVPENRGANHLLGVPGKINQKTGNYATWIKNIPKTQPKTTLEDVKFNLDVSTWNVSENTIYDAKDYAATIPKEEFERVHSDTKYVGGLYSSKW